jgi:protein-S-isoprenylcysteine O-methyltransferase Ste14
MDTHLSGKVSVEKNQTTRGVVRWLVRETMGVIMSVLLLFLSAGRWDWLWGWVAVGVLVFWVGATALAVIPQHPQVLAERLGPRKDAKRWDTAIVSLIGVIILAVYIVAGLDVRNGWTVGFPNAAQLAGAFAALLGYSVLVWATASNAFFSLNVRIQSERGHSVATGGPYRFVRHPGYVGSILAYLGTPVLLGSWWAILFGFGMVVLMIVRTALEDRTLEAELPGYQQYAQNVRFRLFPGLW